MLLSNLFLGIGTMMLCLVLQLALLTRALMFYAGRRSRLQRASPWVEFSVLNGVMLLLMLGNLGQVAIWAVLFQWLGEFGDYRVAFYHSAVNFATLGYGDLVMSEQRRLLGPLESMNGILMVGVTTAAFMTILRDALLHVRGTAPGTGAGSDAQLEQVLKQKH
jgi:hypothetical protein